MTALATDSDVVARFTDDPGDPVLAAHQLVAELAQIYYEKPNDDIAESGRGRGPDRLVGRPGLRQGPAGGVGRQSHHRARHHLRASSPPSPARQLPQPVQAQPVRSPVAPSRRPPSAPSGPGSTDSPTPRPRPGRSAPSSARWCWPARPTRCVPASSRPCSTTPAPPLDAQLAQLEVAGQPITLTSQRGRLPISIFSSATYPVQRLADPDQRQAALRRQGPHPVHRSRSPLIPQHTNVIYVNVQTRVSGVFKVAITLHSPTGGLLLSSGQISVRSTATSVVGIVLSLGAVVVLVVWWVRTSRKRRALRRHDEAGGGPGRRGRPVTDVEVDGLPAAPGGGGAAPVRRHRGDGHRHHPVPGHRTGPHRGPGRGA